MNTDALQLSRPSVSREPGRRLRRGWGVVTALLVGGVFVQAVLAGAILSGIDWARPAHGALAALLVVAAVLAGLVALVTLRRTPNGAGLGLTLVALAVALALQAAVGSLAAKGANLLWVHVPLGVALLGFAAQAAAGVRKLGG